MKRYGRIKSGDMIRYKCICCATKYSHSKHRGSKKRARQNDKKLENENLKD